MTRTTPTPETITLHVPFRIAKRGGKKIMIAPDGAECTPRPRVDSALVKALARAHRWKRLLDSGEYSTIADLAEHERIAAPFLTRTLRLALLSPDLVEAILDGCQPIDLSLETLRRPLPADWSEQKRLLSFEGPFGSADQIRGFTRGCARDRVSKMRQV